MFKNPIVKNILSALAVAVFGYVLLNLAFLLDFLFQTLLRGFFVLFLPADFNMNLRWFPYLMHFAFVILIGLISWAIFRTKMRVLFKAIYLTVPTATVLVTLGIFFYHWPVIQDILGFLLVAGTLYYFYRAKQPWLYYYTVILIGLTLFISNLLGMEI